MKNVKLILMMFVIASNQALAEEPAPKAANSYVSGQFGTAILTSSASSGKSYFTYGARIGTGIAQDPNSTLSIGLHIQNVSNSQTISGIDVSTSTTGLALELIARKAFNTGLYFGGRVGAGFGGATVGGISGSSTSFLFGPVAGYEVQLTNSPVTLGVDAAWISYGKSKLKFDTGTTIGIDSYNTLLLNVGITYHW